MAIPYRRREYETLSANEKKQVLNCAARVQEYNVTRGQLALLRILKSDDPKMIEKMKKLEARLAAQEKQLPMTSRRQAWIKE